MTITSENSDILMRRLDELYDQINRIRVCLKDISEGKEVEIGFSDEIYTEMASDKNSIESHAARVVEHLLKLKYCTTNWNYDVWRNSVELHLSAIEDITKYLSKKKKSEFVEHYENTFIDSYLTGINYYNIAMNKFDDLKDNRKFIPEKCPWTPMELLIKPTQWLLDKLPDPDEITTQMQLYTFCKYYRDISPIKGKLCTECKFYSECVSKYHDKVTRE